MHTHLEAEKHVEHRARDGEALRVAAVHAASGVLQHADDAEAVARPEEFVRQVDVVVLEPVVAADLPRVPEGEEVGEEEPDRLLLDQVALHLRHAERDAEAPISAGGRASERARQGSW